MPQSHMALRDPPSPWRILCLWVHLGSPLDWEHEVRGHPAQHKVLNKCLWSQHSTLMRRRTGLGPCKQVRGRENPGL